MINSNLEGLASHKATKLFRSTPRSSVVVHCLETRTLLGSMSFLL